MLYKQLLFILIAVSSSAQAMGSRGPSSPASAWLCDRLIPKSETSCASHATEVRAYLNRCVPLTGVGAVRPLIDHQAAFLVFNRELDLLYRLRPVANYMNEWTEFETRWRGFMNSHPEILASERDEVLNAEFRTPFQNFLNNSSLYLKHAFELEAEMQSHLRLSTERPASFYLLGAALVLRLLEDRPPSLLRSEEQAWYETAYPELKRVKLESLTQVYFSVAGHSASDVAQAVAKLSREHGEPDDASRRFAHVLEFLDRTLYTHPHHDYFVHWLEREFLDAHTDLVAELEQSLGDDNQSDPLVLASAQRASNSTNRLLAQNLWATQCRAWHDTKSWSTLAHLNNKYLGQAVNYSLAAFLATTGSGLIADASGALFPQAKPGFRLLARLADRGTWFSSLALFGLAAPNSAIALATTTRARQMALHDFYLSPVPLAQSSPDRRAQLLSDERWAIFGVVANLVPFGYYGWQRLAHP